MKRVASFSPASQSVSQSVSQRCQRCENHLSVSSKLVIIVQNYYNLIAVARIFAKRQNKIDTKK